MLILGYTHVDISTFGMIKTGKTKLTIVLIKSRNESYRQRLKTLERNNWIA